MPSFSRLTAAICFLVHITPTFAENLIASFLHVTLLAKFTLVTLSLWSLLAKEPPLSCDTISAQTKFIEFVCDQTRDLVIDFQLSQFFNLGLLE